MWTENLFIRVEVRIADEEGQRHLLAVEHSNELSKGARSVTIIPRFVIEDLYKEMVMSEVEEVRAELAQLTEKLATAETQQEAQHDSTA